MFRLHARSGSGRRCLWISVATVAALTAAAPAQADPFAYVANFDSDTVSQYDVGAGGLLAPLVPPTVTADEFPEDVAVSPDGRSVYVANVVSFRVGQAGDVSQYDVGVGGALQAKSPASVAAGGQPLAVAVSPDGGSVYVANETAILPPGSGNVFQYDVGASGALQAKSPPSVSTNGAASGVAVSPDGRSVYVTNECSETVSQYDVGAGGALHAKSPATAAAGHCPFGVAVSPDGQSVYVANTGSNDVSQYDVASGGALTPKSPPAATAGSDPLQVAASPGGGSAYVTNFGSDNVSQYDVGAGGALTPKSPATVAAGSKPSGVAVSPDGRSVYVTNGGGASVSQYDVGAGGGLSPKSPATVAAGSEPVEVAVGPLPRVPTTKAQCKHGGWKRFGFKSQGRCIRFVIRRPKG